MSKQKKTGKGCWIAMPGIGLLACAGLAAMIFLKLCPPQGPWPQPPWCEGSPFTQAAIADLQPDLAPLQFTVFVPPNTPPNTILYLELYDPDKNGIGNYALNPVSETEWALKNPWVDNELEKYKTLYYRYNRNNWGYAGAEELSPDSPNTFRTIRIEDEPSTITDTVAQWRWLPKEGERLPVVQPHVQPFAARVTTCRSKTAPCWQIFGGISSTISSPAPTSNCGAAIFNGWRSHPPGIICRPSRCR